MNAESRKASRAAHKAESAAYDAGYRAAHLEARRAAAAAWQAAHSEAALAHKAAYRARHREEERARRAARAAAHPDQQRERNRKTSARRRGAPVCEHAGCLTLGAAQLAWMTSEHACWMCGTPLWQGVNLHMDHVLPVARGGLHCAENLRPACPPCNLRKGAR